MPQEPPSQPPAHAWQDAFVGFGGLLPDCCCWRRFCCRQHRCASFPGALLCRNCFRAALRCNTELFILDLAQCDTKLQAALLCRTSLALQDIPCFAGLQCCYCMAGWICAHAHPPSMGLPEPLKMRPSMSRDTGVFNTCGKQEEEGANAWATTGPKCLLVSCSWRLSAVVVLNAPEGQGTGIFSCCVLLCRCKCHPLAQLVPTMLQHTACLRVHNHCYNHKLVDALTYTLKKVP
jgi:hypothetical protein